MGGQGLSEVRDISKGGWCFAHEKSDKKFRKKKKAVNNRNGEAKAALRKILEPDS